MLLHGGAKASPQVYHPSAEALVQVSSPQAQGTPSLLSRRSGEEVLGQIRSMRLHPYMSEGIKVLEHCGELQRAPEAESLLLQINHSSIDRCLTLVRFPQPRGRSTTKPGSLLRKQIPIRTFADCTENKPRFFLISAEKDCRNSKSITNKANTGSHG